MIDSSINSITDITIAPYRSMFLHPSLKSHKPSATTTTKRTVLPNPMRLVTTSDLHITVENDHVILRGNTEESSGVMLRGSVFLNCHEITKVRSISLKFTGIAKVDWTEGLSTHQKHYKHKKTIINHEWSFLPSNHKIYNLPKGDYKWDFELPLPGNLPKSVQNDFGEVSYQFKAVVDRPTFSINYTDKKIIHLSRIFLPSSLELTQSFVISNTWSNKIGYEIDVPSKTFEMGSCIPVTFAFSPIAQGLQVRSVSCVLKEYTTLSASKHSRTEERVITHLLDENFSSGSDKWEKIELLYVPDHSSHSVQIDSLCDLIEVKHKLEFTVSLINANGHISELKTATPIIIAEMLSKKDKIVLPTYEDAWKSALYNPQQVLQSEHPPSLASEASSLFSSSDIDDEAKCGQSLSNETSLDDSTWQGIDLSRVPSYITAIQSNRIDSFSDSSPNYYTVVVALPGSK